MHDELIYQFAVTEGEDEAYEILLLMIEQYLAQYTAARELFALENEFALEGHSDESTLNDYALHLFSLLADMRARAREKEEALREAELTQVAQMAALYKFVMAAYETINATERGNAIQMGQLSAITALQDQRGDIRIYKEWVAHPDCCEICKRLRTCIHSKTLPDC